MKQKKQRNLWMGLLLTVMLVVSMVMPAMATEGSTPTGSITITGAVEGQTYNVYKIFNLESYDATNNRYSYRVLSAWSSFGWEDKGIKLDEDGYVTNVGEFSAEKAASLAKALLAYANTNSIAAEVGKQVTATTSTVKITGLTLGYYLVDTSLGALCGLGTTAEEVNIAEKNSEPTLGKKVLNFTKFERDAAVSNEDEDVKNYEESVTASIGDIVEYKLTVGVGAEKKLGLGTGVDEDYVITDKLPAGVNYVVDSVKIGDWASTDYSVQYNPATQDTLATLTITLNQTKLATMSQNSTVAITYRGTVNSSVAIGSANTNKAKLTYGTYETTEDTAVVYSYGFDLVKTDTDNKVITGAKFKLYDAETGGTEIKVVKNNDGTYSVTTDAAGVEIEAGKVTINGLANGTYYVEETEAPTGYNKLTARQAVTINGASNSATVTDNVYKEGGIQIINKTGSILPSTGGMGTTIFYIVGAGLVLVAGVLLITRKRMSAEEK